MCIVCLFSQLCICDRESRPPNSNTPPPVRTPVCLRYEQMSISGGRATHVRQEGRKKVCYATTTQAEAAAALPKAKDSRTQTHGRNGGVDEPYPPARRDGGG